MEKLKIFLLGASPFIAAVFIGLILFYNSSPVKIKTICKKLEFIDANTDHNQALDVIAAVKENKIKIPETIINFDTHSDMYVFKGINPKYGAHIYDWLNEYFAKNPETKVLYWVMPDEEAADKGVQREFVYGYHDMLPDVLLGNISKNDDGINPEVHKIPYVQYFLIDTDSSYMVEIADKNDEKKFREKYPAYKKIKVVTCTGKTLPDFKNKNVVLSIDFDYITNSGYDTVNAFTIDRTPREIFWETSKLLSILRKKHIRPDIISLTLSPKYVPDNDKDQIYDFMQYFVKYSGKKDVITEYMHQADSPVVKTGQEKYKSF